jgi:predicted Fe-Mo cluster-binding NifX family protein
MGDANVTGSSGTRLKRLLRRVARIAVALLITYTAASVVWRSYGSNQFELAIDRNGIKVYTLKAPGETLRMVKAVTRVRSSMAGLVTLLTETCGEYEVQQPAPTRGIGRIAATLFPKQGCIDDGEFYRVDEHLQYGKFRLPFPFPFRAREFVVRSDLHQDPRTGKLWIEYAAAPEQVPPNDCCVRLRHMNNFVQLTPLGNGLVGIDYVLNMDAGGYLPDLVASFMYPKFIFNVLRGLQPRLAQGKYQKAKIDLIVEQ